MNTAGTNSTVPFRISSCAGSIAGPPTRDAGAFLESRTARTPSCRAGPRRGSLAGPRQGSCGRNRSRRVEGLVGTVSEQLRVGFGLPGSRHVTGGLGAATREVRTATHLVVTNDDSAR